MAFIGNGSDTEIREQCTCVSLGFFFLSSRRRHTRSYGDWCSDVCSSDLGLVRGVPSRAEPGARPLGAAGLRDLPPLTSVIGPLPPGENFVLACSRFRDESHDLCVTRRSEERRVGKECRCQWWR